MDHAAAVRAPTSGDCYRTLTKALRDTTLALLFGLADAGSERGSSSRLLIGRRKTGVGLERAPIWYINLAKLIRTMGCMVQAYAGI
jgi:hypothetical protein